VDPVLGTLYLGKTGAALLYFLIEVTTFFVFYYFLPNALSAPSSQSMIGIVFLPIRLTGVVHTYLAATRTVFGRDNKWHSRWYLLGLATIGLIFVALLLWPTLSPS
jgi:hypothetical protein